MIKYLKNLFRPLVSKNFISWTHKARAIFASILYGFPARKLKVVGVTGTNGKTTTCNLIASILDEAGYKVGLATTINFRIGKKDSPNITRMTTISPFLLQKLLREMVKEGCHWAVIETTSHAISQFRNWGINYDAAILTNITPEHLDYHKNMEEYRDTKMKLFKKASIAILNTDDRSYKLFNQSLNTKQLSYGIYEKADIMAKKILHEAEGSLFTVVTNDGQYPVNLGLTGEFNISNALAAISFAISQNISMEVITRALEKITNISGRMEKIVEDQDYTIIIDYAHTPDAFEKIYKTLRPAVKGKIIHVFGACGDRDKTKRPIMGAQAGRNADYIILTNEDPYTEDPKSIITQVASGVSRGTSQKNKKKKGENFFIIMDRREAIDKALSLAKKDDLVLITGKGAEKCMVICDEKIAWSDKEVIKELLLDRGIYKKEN